MISIRAAQSDDLPEIFALWQALMANGEASDPRYRLAPNGADRMRQYIHDGWFVDRPFPRTLLAVDPQPVGFIQGVIVD